MAENQTKYSSPYTLIRQPIEQTKIYTLYNARNKKTGQIWLAKIFHHNAIQQLSMGDHIEYNQEVLQNLRQKQNVIYVSQIFLKGDHTYLIQQKFQIRLSDYLSNQVTLKPSQIAKIIKDVFQGVCDIYEQRYIHCNLRTDHIVKVIGQTPDDITWKIQAMVLNSQQFPIDTPFTWKRATASPQDKNKTEDLEEEQQDEQLVWNFGYMALEMLMGSLFMQKKASKQSDVPWAQIKSQTKDNPELYELINACYRHKYKDRVSLKKFFSLQIFDDVSRPGITDYFLTASKIFKANTLSNIQKSINNKGAKSVRFQSKILGKTQKSGKDYFHKLQEVSQHVFDEIDQDAARFCFLLKVKDYLSLVNVGAQEMKMKENRVLIGYYFGKLGLKYEERGRGRNKNVRIDTLQEQSESQIQAQSRNIKRIKDNELLKRFSVDPKKQYSLQQLVSIFNKFNGYAYTRVQQSCQSKQDPALLKALAYFSLLGYLINFDNWKDLDALTGSAHSDYLELFETTNLDTLVRFTQNLIKQHFKQAE